MQKWLVMNKKADFKAIGEKYKIDQVTARIIRNRDVIEDEQIRQFLYGGMADLHNPHLLKDGEKLVSILSEKIKEKKSIRVIGDYDIDGVMATYILVSALQKCGAIVSTQIPDRIHDGYGLNKSLIDKAYEDDVDTILTCDNGIAAIEEIAYAKSLGLTVLVTDHHEIPYVEVEGVREYKVSVADAIVNPHQAECVYPYKQLCGAAVAWKVVCLLYEISGIAAIESEAFLENVAFATVGDIMSLTGENRILVKEGLKRIRRTKNIGMRSLIAQCGIEADKIDAFHFGFVLGPCINASGRLDTAKRALELFFQKDEAKAAQIANELVVLNNERKELTIEGVEKAIAFCEKTGCYKDDILVIYLPEVHESIAGIIAGRIREKYQKPVFVLTKTEVGVKGSGRSIEEYSMYEEMCKCQELFTKFGGHPMAAGLSLPEENVDVFRMKINENSSLSDEDFIQKVRIDVPMPMSYVSMDLVREFSLLAPFGKDNTKPVFADKGVLVKRMWIMGKNRNVLKLSLVTSDGMPVSGIYFGDVELFTDYVEAKFGKEQVQAAFDGKANNLELSVVYFPKINSFRGVEELQFEIQLFQ
ncbi:MAG: single-stranded-DNA-specific exonuclease RecJ [Agathobacter sp.]|nr:single-stranded-DNA-specific exonuclease RecJ [Agathobacter sp.]